jgi:hypothetical protein
VTADDEDLDALGRRHARLQEQLAEVRSKLAPAIRAERKKGAKLQELLRRSGYHSLEAIRQIIDPRRRERFNRRRRGESKDGDA